MGFLTSTYCSLYFLSSFTTHILTWDSVWNFLLVPCCKTELPWLESFVTSHESLVSSHVQQGKVHLEMRLNEVITENGSVGQHLLVRWVTRLPLLPVKWGLIQSYELGMLAGNLESRWNFKSWSSWSNLVKLNYEKNVMKRGKERDKNPCLASSTVHETCKYTGQKGIKGINTKS